MRAKAEQTFYCQTFRVSKKTEFSTIHKAACDFWGISLKDYTIHDEFGAMQNTSEDAQGMQSKVETLNDPSKSKQ